MIASLLLLGAIAAGAEFYIKSKAGESWPAPYNTLCVGSTQQEVLEKVGKPVSQSTNPFFESKTPAQWSAIEAQLDDMATLTTNPYATIPASEHARYVSLSRSLEHRIKTVWIYPPISTTSGNVAMSFDSDGKLIRFVVLIRPSPGRPVGANGPH